MANIQKYSSKLPAIGNLDINDFLRYKDVNDFGKVEMIIVVRKGRLNVKELSSYLNFIYLIDGHLSETGLLKYSHHPHRQIEISDIRLGSYELVFDWFLNAASTYDTAIIIYLALKFLPKVVQTYLDTLYKAYQIADTREDFLEKRHKREMRENKEQVDKKEK